MLRLSDRPSAPRIARLEGGRLSDLSSLIWIYPRGTRSVGGDLSAGTFPGGPPVFPGRHQTDGSRLSAPRPFGTRDWKHALPGCRSSGPMLEARLPVPVRDRRTARGYVIATVLVAQQVERVDRPAARTPADRLGEVERIRRRQHLLGRSDPSALLASPALDRHASILAVSLAIPQVPGFRGSPESKPRPTFGTPVPGVSAQPDIPATRSGEQAAPIGGRAQRPETVGIQDARLGVLGGLSARERECRWRKRTTGEPKPRPGLPRTLLPCCVPLTWGAFLFEVPRSPGRRSRAHAAPDTTRVAGRVSPS